jgi:hypothetical protein
MKNVSFVVASLGLALGACGGGGGGSSPDARQPNNTIDARATIDAPPSVGCLAASSYGAIEPGQQAIAQGGPPPTMINMFGALNQDSTPDFISLELWKGYGPFGDTTNPTDIVPGTYTISGDETQYATCGVCILVLTDFDPNTMMVAGTPYLASSGSVTITSVSPNITGTFSNLVFQHVEINEMDATSTPSADGCTTALAAGSFDAPVSAAFAPGFAPAMPRKAGARR